jgi:hypothetical protein
MLGERKFGARGGFSRFRKGAFTLGDSTAQPYLENWAPRNDFPSFSPVAYRLSAPTRTACN